MLGTGVALITPFTPSNTVDFTALGKIIDHVINGGVDYVVALGTTGEAPTLSSKEKKEIYQFISSHVNGRVDCVAGIGGNNTAELTETLRQFDYTGYKAVLSVSPYYNKPNQEGIYQHYLQVAESSKVPVILYNVPGRTGSMMSAATTLRLANASKNIIATKEASGNAEQFMDILKDKPEGFSVISGDDNLTLPFLSMGMTGVISVIANAFPRTYSDLVRLGLKGDFASARALHFQLYDAMKAIFTDGSPGGIKVIMNEMGLCENIVRAPLAPVNAELEARLRKLAHTAA